MPDYETILYDVTDKVGVITLNRPERLNATTAVLYAEVSQALEAAQADNGVNCVVITGAGRGFCSGADLSGRFLADPVEGLPEGVTESIADRRYSVKRVQSVALAAHTLDKPYIAAVNGPAAGSGMDMASMADIRIASTEARFTQAYTRNGLVAGEGGAYYLPRIVGMAKALELLWTSRVFGAEEALAIGYVSRVVPHASLMEETLALAREIAAGPAVAIQYLKQLAYASQEADLPTALRMAQWQQTIVAVTDDAREGRAAGRERRPPRFTGR